MPILSTVAGTHGYGRGKPSIPPALKIVNLSSSIHASRVSTSASSNVTIYSFNFTKQRSDTYLIVAAQISSAGNDNDGQYYFTDISGTRRYDGWSENNYPTYHQYQSISCYQIWTGVSAGSKTFGWGWQPNDGSANRPVNVINVNTSEDGRNRQNGSEFYIFEIEPPV